MKKTVLAGCIVLLAAYASASIVSGLNPADFSSSAVETFSGAYADTAFYDFGNGMTFQNLDGYTDNINTASGYGMGTAESISAGKGGAGDGYFGSQASPSSIQLTFAGGISAFGFYGAEAESSGTAADGQLDIEFYDQGNALIDSVSVSTSGTFAWDQFHGFSSDAEAVGKVIIRDAGWMVMDNVSFIAVPEPGTIGLVGLFGGGLWMFRRFFQMG